MNAFEVFTSFPASVFMMKSTDFVLLLLTISVHGQNDISVETQEDEKSNFVSYDYESPTRNGTNENEEKLEESLNRERGYDEEDLKQFIEERNERIKYTLHSQLANEDLIDMTCTQEQLNGTKFILICK